MDRALLQLHLAEAERHVAVGERNLLRQRYLIATLERDGHDTTDAVALLTSFSELQAIHIADRDRLLRELDA
jgi:hypothetical protein